VQIFFAVWIPPHRRFCVGNNGAPKVRGVHVRDNKARDATSQKSAFHRHFCDMAKFFAGACFAAPIFCCALAEDCAAHAALSRSGAVTHKIKQSHCYFFPAVVIGCQCWSIRDRTAPMSPSTQARRAAMAKKRKTKKKGAKKKKKK